MRLHRQLERRELESKLDGVLGGPVEIVDDDPEPRLDEDHASPVDHGVRHGAIGIVVSLGQIPGLG